MFPEALYAVALLACPVAMGAMMWAMMRGMKAQAGDADADAAAKRAELAALQAQIDQLQAAQRDGGRIGAAHRPSQ